MDDKALFESAMAPEAPVQAEAPVTEAKTEQVTDASQPRDEHGRFAPKAGETTEAAPAETTPAPSVTQPPAAEAKQEPPPGWIPAWRAREIAESRVREALQKVAPPQPVEEIDPYIDPAKFRDQGVRQAIDPIQQRMSQLTEHYSRENAIRVHGQDTVVEAYKWLADASNAGDPGVATVLQKAMSSIDPFREIVTAFKHHKAISTVGDDPNAWFEKELERRKADPAFVSKYLTPAQSNGQPGSTVVKLPPSLTKLPGGVAADATSLDQADLYRHATG